MPRPMIVFEAGRKCFYVREDVLTTNCKISYRTLPSAGIDSFARPVYVLECHHDAFERILRCISPDTKGDNGAIQEYPPLNIITDIVKIAQMLGIDKASALASGYLKALLADPPAGHSPGALRGRFLDIPWVDGVQQCCDALLSPRNKESYLIHSGIANVDDAQAVADYRMERVFAVSPVIMSERNRTTGRHLGWVDKEDVNGLFCEHKLHRKTRLSVGRTAFDGTTASLTSEIVPLWLVSKTYKLRECLLVNPHEDTALEMLEDWKNAAVDWQSSRGARSGSNPEASYCTRDECVAKADADIRRVLGSAKDAIYERLHGVSGGGYIPQHSSKLTSRFEQSGGPVLKLNREHAISANTPAQQPPVTDCAQWSASITTRAEIFSEQGYPPLELGPSLLKSTSLM